MRGVIIGAGEVGKSIHRALSTHYDTALVDKGEQAEGTRDILHVTYPYHEGFVATTVHYAEQYQPRYIVIHSTVRPGTTRTIQKALPEVYVAHAPVEGKHPDLTKSAYNWEKPLGYVHQAMRGGQSAQRLAAYFNDAGIATRFAFEPENTEIGKILSTTKLGLDVIFARMAARICEAHDADYYHAIEQYTKGYNALYSAMGTPQYSRPVLQPSEEPIGGHCVKPNLELIDNDQMNDLKRFILEHELYGT